MREGILQPHRRAQRAGKKGRYDVVNQYALALDCSRTLRFAANGTRHIRGHSVAVVTVRLGIGRRRARGKRLRLKTCQQTGDDISRSPGARPVPIRWQPGFVIPRDDISLRVQAGALIQNKCVSVVLPGHFVFARKLHTNRFAYRL